MELRKQICNKRAELSVDFRQQSAQKIADTISAMKIFQQSERIALYFAMNGEVDPSLLMQYAWNAGKTCYLPVLTKHKTLQFVKYAKDDLLVNNSFNIPEPNLTQDDLIAPEDLDMVIVPLVGFDINGNRLGMGCGYYDRTFSFTKNSSGHQKTCLVGVAYEFQNLSQIDANPWDVPMNIIVTEITSRYCCSCAK